MGNNPSKDDPLPTLSTYSATLNSSGSNDLEQQEDASVQAALSRPSDSLTSSKRESKESGYSASSAIMIEKVTNTTINRSISNSSNLQSNKNNKGNNGKHGRYLSGKSPRKLDSADLDLDLEIGASMARLLSSNNTNDESVSSSPEYLYTRPTLAVPSSYSSLDSEKSNIVSPVFTSSGDDLSLSLSSYSMPNGDEQQEKLVNAPPSDLEPIFEGSLESTPTPETNRISASLSTVSRSSTSSSSHTNGNTTNQKSQLLRILNYKAKSSSTSTLSSPSVSPPLLSIRSSSKEDLDLDLMIDRLLEIGMKRPSTSSSARRKAQKDKLPLTINEIKYILTKSRSIFLDQPTLLRLSPPVKIVGDIHGQFHDLIRIFNSCGYPPYTNYLFLGDYVDRGYKSLETILLLLCYKIKYPENFFMLRGNHESANITKIYGFYDECKRRLPSLTGNSSKLWKSFIDVFNTLPIAATINDKVFCIHGGLSPDLNDLIQIENIKRPTDIPDKGLLADLLWSDPDPLIKNFSISNWPKNDRGVSYCFGRKHVDYFCSKFRMDLIVRGHMVVEDGYEFFNKRKLVTIFSAPNYCGEFDNFGAVMSVDKKLCCSFELLKPLK